MTWLHRDLFELLRGYSALVPPRCLSFPYHISFIDVHSFFLDSILLNSHLQTYSPSRPFQHSFWKWAIHHLENFDGEDVEIDPRIFDHYMSLLPVSAPGLGGIQPPPSSYVTHFWKTQDITESEDTASYQTTTLLESRTTIESGTTGMRTWTACLILAQYIILHPELVVGKMVLEIGCGTGFLGIVTASLQRLHHSDFEPNDQYAICLTDNNEEVLGRCRDNVGLPCNTSSRHPNITYRILEWGNTKMDFPLNAQVILGADIVFDPTLIDPLISTLRSLLTPSEGITSKAAFIALTIRNENTLAQFLGASRETQVVLTVQDLNIHFDKDMFVGVQEGNNASVVKPDVKIYRVTLKE